MSHPPAPCLSNVTVCTVHYRRPRLLEVQLSRLRRHGWPAAILVLDNGSPPEDSALLRATAAAQGARFGVAPRRVSHGLGLDLLVGRVTTPWMLALDSDAWPVCDGWLEKLTKYLKHDTVLAGPRCVRRHESEPSRAFAEPYCMLVDVQWYYSSGARCADRWPEWDTAEHLSIRAKEENRSIAWFPVSTAEPWCGDIACSAIYHSWYATRVETLPADFLAETDGLDVARQRASLDALFAAESAHDSGTGPDPWQNVVAPKN